MSSFALVENVPDYTNLSKSFKSLLSLPIKFISRMNKIDEQDVFLRQEQRVEREFMKQFEAESKSLAGFPGPFNFMFSGYAFGLLVMAILLNRIEHLVVPTVPNRNRHQPQTLRSYSIIRILWDCILPLNLSNTTSRLILRWPSLYLMGRSVLMLGVVLLQASEKWPEWEWSWWQALGTWVAATPMTEICWSIFIAICSATATAQLTAGLEGPPASPSPFNLFGYSFLLHMYSSSVMHVGRKDAATSGIASRPDVHVIITMFLPLFQLAVVHFMGIRKSWSGRRLIPSTFCGLLSLAHFHYVLFLSPSTYPLLNYLPSLLESLLLAITAITVFLNVMTQLLLEGVITRPLFGTNSSNEMNLFGVHPSAMPKQHEDFSIAILRLGTASFEATGVAGLGNEVTTINSTVVLDRGGVQQLEASARAGAGGFDNEVKSVNAFVPLEDGELRVLSPWVTEVRRYIGSLGRVAMTGWQWIWKSIRRGSSYHPQLDQTERTNGPPGKPHGLMTPPRERSPDRSSEDDEYQKFIRGQSVADDSEDEFVPSPTISRASSISVSADDETNPTDGDWEPPEAIGLYSDLTSAQVPDRPTTPVIVAHLTSNSPHLTRSRYHGMADTASSQSTSDWLGFIQERRRNAESARESASAESRTNCVICTVEPRDVICWPCKCLALCNDCRSNLASRSAAQKHSCPCCRKRVEGFSRIYIP